MASGRDRYVVDMTATAAKQLSKLSDQHRQQIGPKIAALADDPRPCGAEKLTGSNELRIRAGDLRAVYVLDDAARIITVVRVAKRDEVYRRRR